MIGTIQSIKTLIKIMVYGILKNVGVFYINFKFHGTLKTVLD